MNRLYTLIFTLFVCISFNCQKEVDYSNLPGGIDPPAQPGAITVATVQGTIMDETGKPTFGVSVKAGSKVAITDKDGYFRIINAGLNKDAAFVTAEKKGYFKAYRTFTATKGANHVVIKLIKKQLVGIIPASGGELSFANGAKLSLPGNGVVKANGGSFSGEIKVYGAYIDPTADDISRIVPGSFMANDKNGKRVTLASFGMVAIELESASGEKLQVAPSAEATLTMPIPASIRTGAPSTISLWFVDEKTGLWKEEGKADRVGDNYVGTVKHFSFWNCDIGMPASYLTMKLVSKAGTPLVHARVKISIPNSNIGAAYGYTDSLGVISGLVPSGMAMLLEVLDECNAAAYSQNISPVTTATDLGVVMVDNSTALYTITGKLVNCANAPVANGSVQIVFGYMTYNLKPAGDGSFTISFIKCGSQGNEISVTGFDDQANQMGEVETFPVSLPETNTGNIKACGTSTEEYFSYTINGVEYSITGSTPSNWLSAFVAPSFDSTSYLTTIYAMSSAGQDSIQLEFSSPQQVAGSYPLKHLDMRDYRNIVPVNAVNVNLTRYAATVSGIYEGSFSGQFRDSLDQTSVYTISASFRIKRE